MNPGGVLAALVLVSALLTLVFLGMVRRRRAEAAMRAESSGFIRKAAEGLPLLTPADAEALERWLADNTLPYVALVTRDEPPASDQASRIGGPAWLAEGQDWPVSRDGVPMMLLAQINFAELAAPPDYPERGILLVFASDGEFTGADFGDPVNSDKAVIFAPDPAAPGRLVHRSGPPLRESPFNGGVAETGRAVTFESGLMPPSASDYRIDQLWPKSWARDPEKRFEKLLERETDSARHIFYIGGHPRFTQDDIREGALSGHDRVLLQLGSDFSTMMWGDMGEATFLIRRDDLLARNFSSVAYSWDCS